MLLRAVAAVREREEKWVVALQRAEPPMVSRVVGQLVVGNVPPGVMSGRIATSLR